MAQVHLHQVDIPLKKNSIIKIILYYLYKNKLFIGKVEIAKPGTLLTVRDDWTLFVTGALENDVPTDSGLAKSVAKGGGLEKSEVVTGGGTEKSCVKFTKVLLFELVEIDDWWFSDPPPKEIKLLFVWPVDVGEIGIPLVPNCCCESRVDI